MCAVLSTDHGIPDAAVTANQALLVGMHPGPRVSRDEVARRQYARRIELSFTARRTAPVRVTRQSTSINREALHYYYQYMTRIR